MRRDIHLTQKNAGRYLKLAGVHPQLVWDATSVWLPGRNAGWYYAFTDLQAFVIKQGKQPPPPDSVLSRFQRMRHKQDV